MTFAFAIAGGASCGPFTAPEDDPVPAPPPRACATPAGVSGSPQTIGEAVDLINALPKPTSLACYLESLDRPLRLYATRGTVSAQPAVGERSPRIFMFTGPLIGSVVPDGVGSELLEFGQLVGLHSIKGELHFPVETPLPPEAPYQRVMFDEAVTSCAFCHRAEAPGMRVGTSTAFSSRALRPVPYERVLLSAVQQEAETCDHTVEPLRCDLLEALFGHGQIVFQEFPQELPTFFD